MKPMSSILLLLVLSGCAEPERKLESITASLRVPESHFTMGPQPFPRSWPLGEVVVEGQPLTVRLRQTTDSYFVELTGAASSGIMEQVPAPYVPTGIDVTFIS